MSPVRLTRSDVGVRLPRWVPPPETPGPPGSTVTPEQEEPAVRVRRSAGVDALGATDITVRFGDLVANDEVSLSAAAGMVTALIGPNGAGKTTFFNVLTGAVRPASGRVTVNGSDVGAITPARAARLGVIRTFQNLKVLPRLTVFENVALGAARSARTGLPATLAGLPAARRAEAAAREAANWALDFVSVGAPPDALVADLPYGRSEEHTSELQSQS